MEIDDRDNPEKPVEPKLRSINEEFEVTDAAITIRQRGPGQEPLGMIKIKELKAIEIKAAGTFYDGEVSFILASGAPIKFKIKKYQQEDFELLKQKLGK